jgi:predicted PhzF superfamily epimerase YddE/YHI9
MIRLLFWADMKTRDIHQVNALSVLAGSRVAVEDSADGTAAGPLAGQLIRREILPENTTVTIEQGYEMKPPSLLHLKFQGESF